MMAIIIGSNPLARWHGFQVCYINVRDKLLQVMDFKFRILKYLTGRPMCHEVANPLRQCITHNK